MEIQLCPNQFRWTEREPVDQCALLSALRRETVDELYTREEEQRIRALERLESYTGSTPGARGGSFWKAKCQKKRRIETNKVMYDDPATRACFEGYDADREPDYPCGDSREFGAWSEGDSEDNDGNMMQCDPRVASLDRCSFLLKRGSSCATPHEILVDLSPRPPLEHQVPWAVLCHAPVSPTPKAQLVVVSPLTEIKAQDHMNRIGIKDYDRGGDRIPYYWPLFRKGPPTIFLPVINLEAPRKVQYHADAKTTTDDNGDIGCTNITRRASYLDELDGQAVDTGDSTCPKHCAFSTPYWLDASSTIDEFLGAIKREPIDLSRKMCDLMEVIDDDFTFAREEDSSGKTRVVGHVVIVSPGINTICEPATGCVGPTMIDDNVPTPTRRLRDDNLAQGRLNTDDVIDNGSEFQDDMMTRLIDAAEVGSTDRVIIEWCCVDDSMLGQASTYSKGCRIIRLTIKDDLRTLEGLEVALDIFNSCPIGRTLLWSAMPCAGGSPWQRHNIARGEGLAKIVTHWADFRALWSNFDVVAQAVMAIEGVVAMNGPHRVPIGESMK
jgi:hypothetical protein